MNRIIKFRAWDSKNHKMLFPMSFQNNVGCSVPNEYLSYNDTEIFLGCRHTYKLMQFTGLLDRNGKEIYEGDRYKVLGSSAIRQIFFHNGAFCGGMSLEESTPLNWEAIDTDMIVDDFISCIEVIGNIYEAANTTGSEIL